MNTDKERTSLACGFYLCSSVFICGLALLAGPSALASEPSRDSTWKLVWHDEFNGRKLDVKKWNVLTREQSKHGELQYYLSDEAFLENGSLHLRSRQRNFGSQHYTSGRVYTKDKFARVYGRFEIRAKLPAGKGLWPAFWLYPQNRDWPMEYLMAEAVAAGKERLIPEERPWYSEIDIMEYLGHETNVIYGTLHYHTFDGQKKSSSGKWKGDVDLSKNFHVYALEWEPNEMRWFLDGQMYHSTTNGIPHTPHYLILNTAVGGKWPGDPENKTVFPQDHAIDYVRVYQRKPL
jgi:beta-glucanase (GH16 family)